MLFCSKNSALHKVSAGFDKQENSVAHFWVFSLISLDNSYIHLDVWRAEENAVVIPPFTSFKGITLLHGAFFFSVKKTV
jgi:hypothetical protein